MARAFRDSYLMSEFHCNLLSSLYAFYSPNQAKVTSRNLPFDISSGPRPSSSRTRNAGAVAASEIQEGEIQREANRSCASGGQVRGGNRTRRLQLPVLIFTFPDFRSFLF